MTYGVSTGGEEKRGASLLTWGLGQPEDPAKVTKEWPERWEENWWVHGPGSQRKTLFQRLLQLTMSNATKKSSEMKTKH